MPYNLKVDMPNLTQDSKVGITGLGEFAQGTHVVSDEEADTFRLLQGRTLEEAFCDPQNPQYGITVTKTNPVKASKGGNE